MRISKPNWKRAKTWWYLKGKLKLLVILGECGILFFIIVIIVLIHHYEKFFGNLFAAPLLYESYIYFIISIIPVILFVGVLSLFFPLITTIYISRSICVRIDEIVERFTRDKLWTVYSSSAADEDSEYEFAKFLSKRLDDYYDMNEYVTFSLLAGIFTFFISSSIAMQLVTLPDDKTPLIKIIDLRGPIWAVLAGSGFLGAFSGAAVLVLKRYRTYNLQPIVFLHTVVALIAGTCSGAFFTITYSGHNIGGFLAFIVGFLTAINIDFLPHLMRSQFAKITGTSLPEEIPSNLSGVVRNTQAIESLNAISIFSIRELASADPVRLYLNMPQQIEMINTMVDQAILYFYFSAIINELEQVNIHRFTQLQEAVGLRFSENHGVIIWPDEVFIIDTGGPKDKALLKAVKGIIEGRLHHQVLGLLDERYRKAFFNQGGGPHLQGAI